MKSTITIWHRLRRTPYQAIGSVFMMFVTLFVLSVFLLLVATSSSILTYFESKPQLTVFFTNEKDKASIDQLVEKLKQTEKVSSWQYISKDQARLLGWDPKKGNLNEVAPGRLIGGDVFKNRNGKLPLDKSYNEADLGYRSGFRGKERIVYSQDGKKIYVTNDHYETFTEMN